MSKSYGGGGGGADVTAPQREFHALSTASYSQPIAQQQESYLKDSKDFINTKLPKNTILASMDVTSLYTNIPQEEGITTVCKAYEDFYKNRLPVPTKFLR